MTAMATFLMTGFMPNVGRRLAHRHNGFICAATAAAYASRDRCQPRRLYRQYCSSDLGTDRRKQTLKPGPGLTATRSPEIIVDNDDVLPAERPRSRRQVVLATAALGVVQQLVRC